MPRRLGIALALLTCICMLAAAAPAQASLTRAEKRLVARINDARADHGLRQLRVRGTLSRGAHSWAHHLLAADSFYHARLAAGTGEILAWGTCSWFRPAKAVRMWLNSSGHRALLLRPGFRYVGTGWSRGPWRDYGCVEMAVARFR
jgi:uncharacterized protein YkwD